MSLADFLDLRITAPVAINPFLRLARDTLGYGLSTTLPYGRQQLNRLFGTSGTDACDGFFSRAGLQDFVSSFHVLMLTKRKTLSSGDFTGQLVVNREPTVVQLRAREGASYLVIAAPPFSFVKLNDAGELIWARIDGKNNVHDIAGVLAKRYAISFRRALADTLRFLRDLHRRHYVY